MEKEGLLSTLSPPPYEAPAYLRRRTRSHILVKRLPSLRTVLSFILTVSVVWLCWVIRREANRDESLPTAIGDKYFAEALEFCAARNRHPSKPDPDSRKENSRWGAGYGQEGRIVLRNATLFDGERFIDSPVDVAFSKGLIESVKKADEHSTVSDAVEYNMHGRYVTPGLVDMHSHHLAIPWPIFQMTGDAAEVSPQTLAVTSMVRIIDGLKAYDLAAKIIASGGVTSSLIIPGSSNLIGGEGTVVKNALYSGPNAEPVVEDMLLERGLPQEERRRYMKMALGENPKGTWGYSRLGNAWHLREHLQKGREIMIKQDDYCASVEATGPLSSDAKAKFIAAKGKFPFDLEMESIVSLLRGQVLLQNHNYEPEDLETMLRISKEFGYKVAGFHHATEAWQVPGMLKDQEPNITIATFAEFSLYKHESYSPSLYAGHILDKSGVKVAYKSDHVASFTNAKYLLSQAAVAHAFHLSSDKALQAVTSVPAAAIDQDHRVGYCRVGYDADVVVWDDHPLSRGATPLQVFIDGISQLNETAVAGTMGTSWTEPRNEKSKEAVAPQTRTEPDDSQRSSICSAAIKANGNYVINGIKKSFLHNYPKLEGKKDIERSENEPRSSNRERDYLQLVIQDGEIACFNTEIECATQSQSVKAKAYHAVLDLENGHAAPGLTALSKALGMREIEADASTGDGVAPNQRITDPSSVAYAKHGIWLDGKLFARARLGGVTRAVTAPSVNFGGGYVSGVSVEIITSGKKSILHGGIVQEDVALHVALDDLAAFAEGAVSAGIKKIREMLTDGLTKNNGTVYGQVARGDLPLLVFAQNKYDIEQLIWIKKDHPEANIVLVGGLEAPFVAKDLANADVPVILTEDRGAPTNFRSKDAFIGPPLTKSVASILHAAGVKFALALYDMQMASDYKIHDLLPEAGWTAKYAGLDEAEAVKLVTSNVEDILHLKKKSKDIVLFEGDPLRYGATVALTFAANDKTGQLDLASCFPRENELVVRPEAL